MTDPTIRPRLIDGEPTCSGEECLAFYMRDGMGVCDGYSVLPGMPCIPGLRRLLAERTEERERWRGARDNTEAMLAAVIADKDTVIRMLTEERDAAEVLCGYLAMELARHEGTAPDTILTTARAVIAEYASPSPDAEGEPGECTNTDDEPDECKACIHECCVGCDNNPNEEDFLDELDD